MKKLASPHRVFGLLIAALTLAATVVRSLGFVLAFDRSVGYFNNGLLSTLFYIILALIPVAAIGYALLVRRAVPMPMESTTLVRSFSTSSVGALTVLIALNLWSLVSNGPHTLTLPLTLVAALAIPYFATSRATAPIWSGISAVICCVLCLVVEYFDASVTINSPIKLMHLLAFLAIALYLLTELFALAGAPKPRRALPLAAVAAAYGIIGGISHVVAALMKDIILLDYLARALVLFAFGLYAAARLAATVCAPQQQDSNTEEN
ncbi:MAG: hypothetical protein J6R04_01290 [Clostridia bacterium]|nr:hypothetical protein [Clostridia bacterium]